MRVLSWLSRPATIAFLVLTYAASAVLSVIAIGWERAELFSPPPTPIIEDRAGNFLTEGESEYRNLGYWDVEGPLNPRIVECITAIEDRRFFHHHGIDFPSLGRSLLNNLTGGDRQGGSTIAMQVARMEYPAPRTMVNKAIEASAGFFLVAKFGRDMVLRQYLKIVPQGNQIHGVAYAARRFFHKPLADATLAEAALLAALPREPGRMNVFDYRGFEAAKTRARLILSLLFTRGQVDAEEHGSALRQLEIMPLPSREQRPFDSYHYILRLLEETKARGPAPYSKPLRASLDPDVQRFLQETAEEALAETRRLDAGNIAIIVADRATGEVLGYIGSSAFFDEEHAGSIDYADTPRSSGSILKPLLFAQGLDAGGFTPGSILADLPFTVLSPKGEYRAANFDNAYLGPMLYRTALANSRNVPALRVLEGVGMEDFYSLMRRLKLAGDPTKDAEYYGYGLAIGGLYIRLADLVAAYGTLANDGKAFSLSWFRRDGDGGEPAASAVFSSYATREISLFLSDDNARLPSFPRMSPLEFPFPVAIKTGTSQGYRDAWTVAYTSKYIVGLWMGNSDNRPMNRVAGVVSAVYVGKILGFLHPLQQEGIDAVPFRVPENTVAMNICVLSGEEAGPDCPSTWVEYFKADQAPRTVCTVHRRFAVDVRSGALAAPATPPSRVALRPFTVLPPVYALWGAQHGYSAPPESSPVIAGSTVGELRISYPENGARYMLDPDTPVKFQSLPLQAAVRPQVREIEWYVDGKLFARSSYPYSARLPLSRGVHTIQAMNADAGLTSDEITVTVE
jgi:penicillin-binding protein 1C